MKKIVWFVFIALSIYGLTVFDDTDEFQQGIKFLVRLIQSTHSFTLPFFWVENRMLIWGIIISFLLLYYRSVWTSFQLLNSIYKNSATIAQKPTLSVQQANYLYLQDKVSSVAVWLIQLCEQGVLTLHHGKGTNPWSISKNTIRKVSSDFDQQLLNNLFQSKNKLPIKDSCSDPDPEFRKLSDCLFQKVALENSHLVKKKTSSFLLWLVLAAMLIEIPFVSAIYSNTPGLVFITLFLVVSTAFVIYFFISLFQEFYNGHFLMVCLIMFIPILIVGISHWGVLGIGGDSGYYFYISFYPEIVVAIAIFVRFSPLLPKDNHLLSHIIAYKNHLQQSQTAISESNISWAIGLQVHSGFYSEKLGYHENQLPIWIESKEEDVQKVMISLHSTFISSINSAVNGEHKSKHRSRRSSSHRF